MGNASSKAATSAAAAARAAAARIPKPADPAALASEISRIPVDPGAAQVAQQHGAGGATVSVQRIMHSGPAAGPSVHDKNSNTVQNVLKFDGAIVDQPDRGVGAKNFQLWQEMQLVSGPTSGLVDNCAQR